MTATTGTIAVLDTKRRCDDSFQRHDNNTGSRCTNVDKRRRSGASPQPPIANPDTDAVTSSIGIIKAVMVVTIKMEAVLIVLARRVPVIVEVVLVVMITVEVVYY